MTGGPPRPALVDVARLAQVWRAMIRHPMNQEWIRLQGVDTLAAHILGHLVTQHTSGTWRATGEGFLIAANCQMAASVAAGRTMRETSGVYVSAIVGLGLLDAASSAALAGAGPVRDAT